MSADKKSFTKVKRHKIAKINETYDHIPNKAMVVKFILGEKNIKKKVHPTGDGFFFKRIWPRCNLSSKTCHLIWPKGAGYSNSYNYSKLLHSQYIVIIAINSN
jgi:hypothetical protein